MNRSTLILFVLAPAAILAGSLWLGVATATAVVFMMMYALRTPRAS